MIVWAVRNKENKQFDFSNKNGLKIFPSKSECENYINKAFQKCWRYKFEPVKVTMEVEE